MDQVTSTSKSTIPAAEPVGYVMHRPTVADKGKYLLFITRPQANPFSGGGGGGTAIFAVDNVVPDLKNGRVRAFSAQGEFSFSADMPYLCLPRVLASPVTTADMARQQIIEKKEWDTVMDAADREDTTQLAVQETTDGRQKNNPGQYL